MHVNSMFPLPKAWLKNPTYVTMGLLGKQGGGNKTMWQLFMSRSIRWRSSSIVCSICYYNSTLLSDLFTLLCQGCCTPYTHHTHPTPKCLSQSILWPHYSLLVTLTDRFRSSLPLRQGQSTV